jgi:tetratricopeptide (TPR) repeat protein
MLVRKALGIQRESRRASQLLTLLSSVLLEKGEFTDAEKAAEGAVELDRLNSEADRLRALVLLRQGRDRELALQLSQKALVCDEEEKALALAVRAWALAANGKDTEARTAIDHALSLPGKQTRPELSELSFYSGKALQLTGDLDAAARCFTAAREAEPKGLFGLLAIQQLREGNTARRLLQPPDPAPHPMPQNALA